ncbi:MAG TPA: hypothetical protein ENJ62_04105 [Bryobacterales bacterium]|nr:hypothetical protein [Bryobacterales bacterium]
MSPLSEEQQVAALAVLRYVSDLFTESPKESFRREDVLVVLNLVQNDPHLFDPTTVARMDQIDSEIQSLGRNDAAGRAAGDAA